MVWVWNTQPGPHDYGDVMAMAYACAAWCGIGSGGTPQRPKRYVERRRCKVEREA